MEALREARVSIEACLSCAIHTFYLYHRTLRHSQTLACYPDHRQATVTPSAFPNAVKCVASSMPCVIATTEQGYCESSPILGEMPFHVLSSVTASSPGSLSPSPLFFICACVVGSPYVSHTFSRPYIGHAHLVNCINFLKH